MGLIYLICFEEKFQHAGHYLGFVEDENDGLEKRLQLHRSGNGSRLLRAVAAAGINFDVVRTWSGRSRSDERKMKNAGGGCRYCLKCKHKYK